MESPSLTNNIVRCIRAGWLIEMASPDGNDDGDHSIRMVNTMTGAVYISRRTDWAERLRPFFLSVVRHVELGLSPVRSAKWQFVGDAKPSLQRHMEKFASYVAENTECRGCEHCDGEGGHSQADSRRQDEAVERLMASRRQAG